tara:strand:- start:425 stop:2464 length:2040 start_codon:yes stop_codon:yes gene_type:complete
MKIIGRGDDTLSLVDLANEVTGLLSLANLNLSTNGTIIVGGANPAAVTGASLAGPGLTATVGDGALALNVIGGTGIDVAADAVSVDVSDFMTNGVDGRIVTATGTDAMDAEAYLQFSHDAGETNTATFQIYSPEDAGDKCTIATTTHGATKIATNDDDATAAHFEVEADGDITLDAAGSIYNEADAIYFTSPNDNDPILNIKNTHSGDLGARLRFTKDKGAAGADGDLIGDIQFYADNTNQELTSFASIQSTVSESLDGDEAGKLSFYVAESNSSSSQLTAGLVLEGEHATDGEVDVTIGAGTASTTTIAGTLTMGSTATLNNSGQLMNGLQPNISTLNGVTSIGAGSTGSTLSVHNTGIIMSHSSGSSPVLQMTNTTNDINGASISLIKDRGAGQDNDFCGLFKFMSMDDSDALQIYGQIYTQVHDATAGEESGKLILQVANHDGGQGSGLILTGGSENNEVDAVIGLGANSLTTVSGDLSVTTGLILDSVDVTAIQTSGESFADNDTSLMTSAAIDDRINRPTKSIQVISANFKDNQGTTETFIPLSAQPEEKTSFGNEQSLLLMPTSGYVREIIIRAHYGTYTSENIVYKIYRRPKNKKVNGSTQIGSDITVAAPLQSVDDDNNTRSTGDLGTTYGYSKWDMLGISMTHQSTGPTSSTDKTYITVVLENDLTDLGY